MFRPVLVSLCLFVSAGVAWGQPTLNGKVKSATDGDTFVMKVGDDEITVRIYGMDAPETKQAFGTTAKKRLAALVEGRDVKVVKKGTSYGRVVGDVYLDDMRVSEKMISEGLAMWYEDFAVGELDLKRAQRDAQEADLGIWKGNDKPLPPWEYRQLVRKLQLEQERKALNP